MKTKITFSMILFVSMVFIGLNKSLFEINNNAVNPPAENPDSEFLIAATHSGIDSNYAVYPDLGANAWHKYCGPTGGWPGVPNDRYDVSYTQYGPDLISKINSNRNHGYRSIMERPKSSYLLYGQRSDYQCENVSRVDPDLWFYTYKNHNAGQDFQDTSQFGNNQWVRYCQVNPDNPGYNAGYVVKDLKANREQSRNQGNAVFSDSLYEWYVMPKIRIDSNVVDINDSTKVCAIVMLDWNGKTIDSVDITAKNFLIQNNYNGNYLEEYNFPDSNLLKIKEGIICPGSTKNFTDWSNTDSTNTIKTDFRVYWYGQCDMWIDYVRVENRPAHELFNQTLFNWDNEIVGEVKLALTGYDAGNPVPNNFYMEEFEFNTIPCMKYFNKIVQDSSQNRLSLMVNLQYNMFRYHIPPDGSGHVEEFSPERIKRCLIDEAGIKYLVNVGYYLTGWRGDEHGVMYPDVNQLPPKSYHPETLSDEDYNDQNGILSYKSSVRYYEQNLQKALDFDHGTDDGFISVLKRTDDISKISPGLKILNLMQVHLWYEKGHKLKEPSNEELNLLANLAIGYGAKGIMYFAYNSVSPSFANTNFYERGLVNTDLTPRDSSVYGQDKWAAVKRINSTLKKWGPNLMSFSNNERKSYIFRIPDERNTLINSSYFNNLQTFPPDPAGHWNPAILSDIPDSSFVQVTTFQNPSEEYNKYFMIVNRRCSPFINDSTNDENNGGRRFLKIKLDSSSTFFSGFNNWSIYNIENDSLIKTFDKSTRADINLGWYHPGEGKLYKLAPVMQEGVTLVADESVSGVNFVCKDEKYNDGMNIRITASKIFLHFIG